MHTGEQTQPPVGSGPAVVPLFKKVIPEDLPVTADSKALFRFGEQCNYKCPMCSNTGEPGLFFRDTAELLRRADFLHGAGFRSVVVTGGEATIHPGFWTVIERLAAHGMRWDTNTHGRTFSKPGFAARAVGLGLERAIVSLHSFDPATSAAIFGTSEAAHHGTVEGVQRLLDAGVEVMLNCVITRLNLDRIEDYLSAGGERFGAAVSFKFVFPSTIGKGGRWEGISSLTYTEVGGPLRRLRKLAAQRGWRVAFESFPNCILDDPEGVSFGRSTFGESHYLDDATGDRVYAMRHIEAELSAFGESCRACPALARCPGVALAYARQHGVGELTPFPV
jgi:MoaA/NifB/PqqE/SkfB family radical SAM enzyme